MLEKDRLRSFSVRLPNDLCHCRITGMKVLEDGRILLCDNQNDKVKLFQHDGTFMSDYFVVGVPLDLDVIDGHRFAVTTEITDKLVILKLVGGVIIHETDLTISYGAVGVCAIGDNFLLTYPWKYPPEILRIDKNGRVIQTMKYNSKLRPIFEEHPISICSFSDQIFISSLCLDGIRDKLYKFTKNGTCLDMLNYPDLKGARYLGKDMFGNVYVCCMKNSKIICVDRISSNSSVIMSTADGLRNPCALAILDQTLFIAQDNKDYIQVLTINRLRENVVKD